MWIDQMCINQNDPVERGRQVGFMGEIYRSAERTVIWLDEGDEKTEFAMTSIRDLLASIEDRGRARGGLPNVMQKLGILYIRSRRWITFKDIFEHLYFRKMEIVQKVVLGLNSFVYCGSHTVTWNDLAKASLRTNSDPERRIEAHRAVQMITGLKRQLDSAVKRPLSSLLNQTYNLLCSDPGDKVYGMPSYQRF